MRRFLVLIVFCILFITSCNSIPAQATTLPVTATITLTQPPTSTFTPTLTSTPEPTPTATPDLILDEVEVNVNLLDENENSKWALTRLQELGLSQEEFYKLREEFDIKKTGRLGIGWDWNDSNILITFNDNLYIILGYRTIEPPSFPGGKLRCLIVAYPSGIIEDQTAHAVALDVQDANGNWALLLPGVSGDSPSDVTKWVDNNSMKLAKNITIIQLLKDPVYLEEPSWINELPGDDDLRKEMINDSYVGWATRDPYAFAMNEKYRKQNTSIDTMHHNLALGFGFHNLERILFPRQPTFGDTCVYGTNISTTKSYFNN
jgi:hypothetical protein